MRGYGISIYLGRIELAWSSERGFQRARRLRVRGAAIWRFGMLVALRGEEDPSARRHADAVRHHPEPERTGTALIAAERRRQVTEEGWTPEHDDEHANSELLHAAKALIHRHAESWPWSDTRLRVYEQLRQGDRVRELVKAGALIAAEIDRLRRRGD